MPASVPSSSTIRSVQAEAEIALEELAVGLHVDGEAVEVVEPAHVDAARRESAAPGSSAPGAGRRRLVPFGLVVELDEVPVRIAEPVGRAVAELALVPADLVAGALQAPATRRCERLRAAGAEGGMAEAGGVRRRSA